MKCVGHNSPTVLRVTQLATDQARSSKKWSCSWRMRSLRGGENVWASPVSKAVVSEPREQLSKSDRTHSQNEDDRDYKTGGGKELGVGNSLNWVSKNLEKSLLSCDPPNKDIMLLLTLRNLYRCHQEQHKCNQRNVSYKYRNCTMYYIIFWEWQVQRALIFSGMKPCILTDQLGVEHLQLQHSL